VPLETIREQAAKIRI